MQKQSVAPVSRSIRSIACRLAVLLVFANTVVHAGPTGNEETVAKSLATFLQSARTVIGNSQYLINDPSIADKGLSGDAVVEEAIAIYRERTGADPRDTDPTSLEGELLRAQMAAVKEVMDENQTTINDPSLAFKGFVPAVFGRLVNERFMEKVGDRAAIKVTAPTVLVRNRKALPDEWESDAIENRLLSSNWPEGQAFMEWTAVDDREAFRFLVPEYYTEGCLSCHGEPKGAMDVTGYPMEGGRLGELGGAISITLFR